MRYSRILFGGRGRWDSIIRDWTVSVQQNIPGVVSSLGRAVWSRVLHSQEAPGRLVRHAAQSPNRIDRQATTMEAEFSQRRRREQVVFPQGENRSGTGTVIAEIDHTSTGILHSNGT